MMSVEELIKRLVSQADKPRNRHELRFLLQWIHDECRLRWPNVSKRAVWDIVKEIDGYNLERD